MIKEKSLINYCRSKLLNFEVEESILKIQGKNYEIVDDQERLFDEDFEFMPFLSSESFDGWVYEFGGRWFLQEKNCEVSLTELLYLGEAVQKLPTKSFLGIHSGNELLNGVGLYERWINKAVFLGIENLGICEKNTLAGVIEFQKKCKENKIKPITGMSIPVSGEGEYEIKIYIKDFIGWQNALKLNSLLNVEQELFIKEDFLESNRDGLFIIFDPKHGEYEACPDFIDLYQVDTVIFEEEEKDIQYLDNLEKFLKSSKEPVQITDAYYIEQEEWEAREKLWGIAKAFDYKTKNQHFKNTDEYAKELISLFDSSNKSWVEIFKKASSNLEKITQECNFQYNTSNRYLPKYIMTSEESSKFSDNEELFLSLIKKGFKEREIKNVQKYVTRLKEEIDVLKAGDVIDYFLILHDIISYAKANDILLGIGRGSAGGSLVSYLLGIIQIDPLEFDLLFARFLNLGRMGRVGECKAFEIHTTEGKVTLIEESILKINRGGKEIAVFIEDLKPDDIIIKY